MSETPTAQQGRHSPANIEFWLEEAQLLQETAEQSWNTNIEATGEFKWIYGPQQDRALRQTSDELGMELNLLYRYLISLAIQYLAIGMLIDRDPNYFLQQPPGHKIVALLDACKVAVTPQQRELLQGIENAFDWSERYPVGKLAGGHDELRQLTHQLSAQDSLSADDKVALDQLYLSLRKAAQNRVT
jgi:hypothetical protein